MVLLSCVAREGKGSYECIHKDQMAQHNRQVLCGLEQCAAEVRLMRVVCSLSLAAMVLLSLERGTEGT